MECIVSIVYHDPSHSPARNEISASQSAHRRIIDQLVVCLCPSGRCDFQWGLSSWIKYWPTFSNNKHILRQYYLLTSAFSALTLLVGRQEEQPACKNWVMRCLCICLQQGGAECLHMVQQMPLHPQTPQSFASFKSRLVSSFWYRLKQTVLEKGTVKRVL